MFELWLQRSSLSLGVPFHSFPFWLFFMVGKASINKHHHHLPPTHQRFEKNTNPSSGGVCQSTVETFCGRNIISVFPTTTTGTKKASGKRSSKRKLQTKATNESNEQKQQNKRDNEISSLYRFT